jgi:hypothetical protein
MASTATAFGDQPPQAGSGYPGAEALTGTLRIVECPLQPRRDTTEIEMGTCLSVPVGRDDLVDAIVEDDQVGDSPGLELTKELNQILGGVGAKLSEVPNADRSGGSTGQGILDLGS